MVDKLKQEKEEIRTELDREILLNEQLNEQIQFGELDEADFDQDDDQGRLTAALAQNQMQVNDGTMFRVARESTFR